MDELDCWVGESELWLRSFVIFSSIKECNINLMFSFWNSKRNQTKICHYPTPGFSSSIREQTQVNRHSMWVYSVTLINSHDMCALCCNVWFPSLVVWSEWECSEVWVPPSLKSHSLNGTDRWLLTPHTHTHTHIKKPHQSIILSFSTRMSIYCQQERGTHSKLYQVSCLNLLFLFGWFELDCDLVQFFIFFV